MIQSILMASDRRVLAMLGLLLGWRCRWWWRRWRWRQCRRWWWGHCWRWWWRHKGWAIESRLTLRKARSECRLCCYPLHSSSCSSEVVIKEIASTKYVTESYEWFIAYLTPNETMHGMQPIHKGQAWGLYIGLKEVTFVLAFEHEMECRWNAD